MRKREQTLSFSAPPVLKVRNRPFLIQCRSKLQRTHTDEGCAPNKAQWLRPEASPSSTKPTSRANMPGMIGTGTRSSTDVEHTSMKWTLRKHERWRLDQRLEHTQLIKGHLHEAFEGFYSTHI